MTASATYDMVREVGRKFVDLSLNKILDSDYC